MKYRRMNDKITATVFTKNCNIMSLFTALMQHIRTELVFSSMIHPIQILKLEHLFKIVEYTCTCIE